MVRNRNCRPNGSVEYTYICICGRDFTGETRVCKLRLKLHAKKSPSCNPVHEVKSYHNIDTRTGKIMD